MQGIEERISVAKDRVIEDTQSEQQRENSLGKIRQPEYQELVRPSQNTEHSCHQTFGDEEKKSKVEKVLNNG